jgi:uncharacterized membrane protein YedE/YeeE
MPASEHAALTHLVLAAAFAIGIAFGAIAQRTQFCTMGALADIVSMGDWTRLRMWALAAAVATLGFSAMAAAGWIDAGDTFYARTPALWLSNAVGGLLFGVGMVLASGCSSKNLVRIGGGSLKAVVVFCVLGLAAYATLRGIGAVARVATVDALRVALPTTQDLPSLLALSTGLARPVSIAVLGLLAGGGLIAWVVARPEGRGVETWFGGLGIGACVALAWWVSGRFGHYAEHPVTLEEGFVATASHGMESLSFVAPIAHAIEWLVLYSDASRRLTFGVAAVAGVVVGSAAVSLATGRFRWEGFAGVEDTALHLVGAALMGVGGVVALGCTVGQGLSGVSTLSIGSFVAVAGIAAGALAALHWQQARLMRALDDGDPR